MAAPILMVSADARELQEADQSAVYDDYLVKPVNNQTLVERIGKFLELEWHYSDQQTPAPVSMEAFLQLEPLPDHPLLRELLAFARIGHKQGVVAKLVEIEAASGVLQPEELTACRQLANQMRLDELASRLEEAMP